MSFILMNSHQEEYFSNSLRFLFCRKTKKELLNDLDAAEARRQAILCEKVQRAKDAARHPHERVAF